MSKHDIEEQLQDELVEDVEVTDEELAEAAAEVVAEEDEEDEDEEEEMEESVDADGVEAADATVKAVKSSASKTAKKLPAGTKGKMATDSYVKEDAFAEDLDALVEGEATLSEAFRGKAGLIFEAALKTKLEEHVERLEESYAEQLEEETQSIKTDLVEKVDGYLNYVVESWMEENQLAVETGLRNEIAESFMDSLRSVFSEHYIAVPEGKADLVDELAGKVAELEESYNAEVAKAVELSESVKELTREKMIAEAAEGLSVAQAEKLKSLVEDIDFSDAETFSGKVETIKESYFKTKVEVQEEELSESVDLGVSSSMQRYLDALKKSS